ncbi:hypothetical protein [Frankia tisae]|uniref:hypothetical protein n=1 Tax=Frankia tisae TaxID=2950104 RepID=UPI0021C23DDD|nr:hypothetical protein [Frankia tisae]
MSTMSWHCDPHLLARYSAGALDAVLAASVEAHLVHCTQCQTAMAAHTDPDESDRIWAGVREAIARPVLPWPVRLLRRCGLNDEDAVLLSVSRSLRGPWTLATVVVLVCAVWASFPDDPRGKAAYLLVAPLVPVLGVVAAFVSVDQTAELAVTTPYSKARLTLLRTLAVIVTTVPLVVAMGALIPGIGWMAVTWLGPAFGLTLTALVGLTWLSAEVIGPAVLAGWAAVVAGAYGHDTVATTVAAPAQLGYLVLTVVTAAVLSLRIRSTNFPGALP